MASWNGYAGLMEQLPTEPTFSLDDLANETGFDRRVIRSFIEQGLMRGPDSMGRYARYSQHHLERLLVIKSLRNEQGMSLIDIRRHLMSMSQQDIRSLIASSEAARMEREEEDDLEAPDLPAESALDYIRSVEQEKSSSKPQGDTGASGFANQLVQAYKRLQPPKQITPLDHLLHQLSKTTRSNRVRNQSRADQWHRISVTPDIELTVRGNQSPADLAKLERIADYLREILMGG